MPGYFEFLGLERRLSLDLDDLQRRFYRLSRELHPDRYARAPPAERSRALEAGAVLNDAYRTLRDPVARAEYMLGAAENGDRMPPELLDEVFEWNEALDGLDAAGRESACVRLEARLSALDARLTELFRAYDAAPAPSVVADIRANLAARRALAKLLARLG